MVTVTKFITNADLKNKICTCNNEELLKVLFREVEESELRMNADANSKGAHILRNEKIVAKCEHCGQVYFIMLTFEGGFNSQYTSINSVEIFDGTIKELRSVLNNMYDEYESEVINMATDDFSVKVLNKFEDNEKTITKYAYLNREDKELYGDFI